MYRRLEETQTLERIDDPYRLNSTIGRSSWVTASADKKGFILFFKVYPTQICIHLLREWASDPPNPRTCDPHDHPVQVTYPFTQFLFFNSNLVQTKAEFLKGTLLKSPSIPSACWYIVHISVGDLLRFVANRWTLWKESQWCFLSEKKYIYTLGRAYLACRGYSINSWSVRLFSCFGACVRMLRVNPIVLTYPPASPCPSTQINFVCAFLPPPRPISCCLSQVQMFRSTLIVAAIAIAISTPVEARRKAGT